ncbi:carboxypeptidase-like regulatory domain-containing protein [Paraflavitalea speifideaquila]|uniref:carboxypeptidase-like regulatory domain-containing protein n=1 Tax=Paraflavitalea speifideaquila TaxID=3076558 RepID=UPI0028E1AAEE|nr:carboxypeptidase-like regulatory domain-containing protein [Paraflavitalea speifideiaquila]
MKKTLLYLTTLLLFSFAAQAGRVTGNVKNQQGDILPYASILVKGTTIGTTTNSQGSYFLDLIPGTYTITCQYVGYSRVEKTVTVTSSSLTLNFELSIQQTTMKEVVVRANAEDPAYEIIRNAIRAKKNYLAPWIPLPAKLISKHLSRPANCRRNYLAKRLKTMIKGHGSGLSRQRHYSPVRITDQNCLQKAQ